MEKQNYDPPAPTKVSSLNCIDLSSPDIHHSVSLLKQACLDCGLFYVINHGISQEFMEEVFAQSKKIFELPLGDYKEEYYIGVEVPEDCPLDDKPFYGPNVWPADDILPNWRHTMEKFHREALEAARTVTRIIVLALDLEVDFYDKPEILGQPIAVLRLLHYAGQVSDPSKGLFGAGAHSDFGLITLLATDDVYGIQICKDKDDKPQQCEFVAPLKVAFIVNLGDMLQLWSNCIFKSTLHRVLGNGQERYSIAYFAEPSHDCLVECLATCKSEINPPKFPPIKYGAYLSQRYKDTHADLSVYNKVQN